MQLKLALALLALFALLAVESRFVKQKKHHDDDHTDDDDDDDDDITDDEDSIDWPTAVKQKKHHDDDHTDDDDDDDDDDDITDDHYWPRRPPIDWPTLIKKKHHTDDHTGDDDDDDDDSAKDAAAKQCEDALSSSCELSILEEFAAELEGFEENPTSAEAREVVARHGGLRNFCRKGLELLQCIIEVATGDQCSDFRQYIDIDNEIRDIRDGYDKLIEKCPADFTKIQRKVNNLLKHFK